MDMVLQMVFSKIFEATISFERLEQLAQCVDQVHFGVATMDMGGYVFADTWVSFQSVPQYARI